jgi:2-isopropylmalate synthase
MAATYGSLMKPLSGWNTRAHRSGIHQQGLSRNTETYSLPVMETWNTAPERIVLSRHSGQAGVALFAQRCCGLTLDEETIAVLISRIKEPTGSKEGTTGLTEFLCTLSDMGKLPPEFPGPLICVSFKETLCSAETGNRVEAAVIEAALQVYGAVEPDREISGRGKNEAAAISQALNGLDRTGLTFSRIALNGFGGKLRLYTVVSFDSGRIYALERAGPQSGAELLFLCGLDAINAEAVRKALNHQHLS